MSIHFFCPLGHELTVPDDRAGKPGRCPVCRQRLFVPEPELAAAPDRADGIDGMLEDAALAADDAPLGAVAEVGCHAELAGPFEREMTLPTGLQPTGSGAAAHEPAAATTHAIRPPLVPGQIAVATLAAPPPAAASASPTDRAPVRWCTWQTSDTLDSQAIFRPDPRQLEVAYWLASLLPFAAVFCAAPALPHMQFAGAPAWAQLMLFTAVLHTGYAAWLALMPDESTLRVGTYVFAATAAAYFSALLTICFLGDPQLSSLGLAGLRGVALAWCGLAVLVASSAAGACRWIARGWQGYSGS